MRFKNKVVLVTGSASGIGKNIARAFGNEGAKVIIANRTKEKANKVISEFRKDGIQAEGFQFDLVKKNNSVKLVKAVVKKWKRIDILINNIRSREKAPLLEIDEKLWELGLAANLKAPFFCTQEAARSMIKQESGCIVNIGSVEGLLAGYDSPLYHIAKAGLIQMTRYFALHMGKYNIRVNCVIPGKIIKDEHRDRYGREDNSEYRETINNCHPLGFPGSSDDVAAATLFLCSDQARFITGQSLIVDGGLTIQEQSGLLLRYKR